MSADETTTPVRLVTVLRWGERKRLGDRREVETTKFNLRGHKWHGAIGRHDDGTIGEVFIDTAKAGSLMRDMANDMATLASLALQYGCPIDVLLGAMTRTEKSSENKSGAASPLSAAIEKMMEDK